MNKKDIDHYSLDMKILPIVRDSLESLRFFYYSTKSFNNNISQEFAVTQVFYCNAL